MTSSLLRQQKEVLQMKIQKASVKAEKGLANALLNESQDTYASSQTNSALIQSMERTVKSATNESAKADRETLNVTHSSQEQSTPNNNTNNTVNTNTVLTPTRSSLAGAGWISSVPSETPDPSISWQASPVSVALVTSSNSLNTVNTSLPVPSDGDEA